jgi:hypothetical protein
MNLALRWLLQGLGLVMVSFSAFADGKIFARVAAVPVATPDQRAMLHFSNDVERLVIETSFIGEGTNFAWVVPLPSAPKIEAVATNFFGYLNMSYQPKLILGASDWWILFSKQGWVFVAATINRTAAPKDTSRPHALAFTFHTDKPVYPLRLTGVENTQCSIELFVFGPERAEATGFRAEYCGKPSLIDEIPAGGFDSRDELFAPPTAGEFRIGNPELLRLAMPAPVTTKLVGTLREHDMQSDALIRWIPFEGIFPTLYTREAAAGAAFNWIVGIAVFGLLLLHLLSPQLNRTMRRRGFAVVILLAAVCGFICFSIAKTTEVVFTHGGPFVAINNFKILDAAVEQYALERKKSGVLTDVELLPALNEYIKGGAKNTFVDKPLRCEPTPGNITMRGYTNGVEVLWHDINNAPRPLATFPITSK